MIALSGVSFSHASTAGPYIKVLKGGKLPANRLAPIIKLVCSRGDGEDLGFVLAETVRSGGYTGEARLTALEGLAEAAANRGVNPEGELRAIAALLPALQGPADQAAQLAVVRLVGLWEVKEAAGELAKLAEAAQASRSLRNAALQALIEIDEEQARSTIEVLCAASQPTAIRFQALAALVRLDLAAAAEQSATALKGLAGSDDPTPLLQAFLDQQSGAEGLAAALEQAALSPDAAKVVLRSIYALGRTDGELLRVLSAAAGISNNPQPLTPEQLKAYSSDVISKGDAARGEQIFRRAELSCAKCHALNGAGGQVGPDLIGLGGSSPNDYLVEAVLVPEKAVKEEYQVVTVLTDEGQILTGIAKERDDQRLIIKDATGVLRTVPLDSIEDEKKGGSLMPKGLANFLTRDELLDLVKFLSDLGRPGGKYERNTEPVVRRWRIWRPEDGPVTQSVPDEATLREQVLSGSSDWTPLYSLCSGELPVADLAKTAPAGVVYLQAQVQTNQAGAFGLDFNDTAGLQAWLDETPLNLAPQVTSEVTAGLHTLTLRVDLAERKTPLRVKLAPGSSAEASLVTGQ